MSVIAYEFSKQFIIVLVSQSIFLFMERDSHTAQVNKMGQVLFLGPESKSLSTAWLTSIWLYSSFSEQSRPVYSAFWEENSIHRCYSKTVMGQFLGEC